MPKLIKRSETRTSAPRATLTYITIGALLVVWSGAWYAFLQPEGNVQRFLCAGFFLTGVVFLIVGTVLGVRGQPKEETEERVARDANHPEIELESNKDRVAAKP